MNIWRLHGMKFIGNWRWFIDQDGCLRLWN
ncbi:hypothetical protein CGLO_03352 [Colletotrichum gloeosporioides Cg-14]|uniref:Uncharacterized protein n=1 Tax=Colletotrichum gloeosporioides (strain Cg-14) TaxID=1237896 RepID=T0M6S7_COLGC|nr:hypothetical protein CGLO_03352 [Colletotrichum gloeosporioides Cg-14]